MDWESECAEEVAGRERIKWQVGLVCREKIGYGLVGSLVDRAIFSWDYRVGGLKFNKYLGGTVWGFLKIKTQKGM